MHYEEKQVRIASDSKAFWGGSASERKHKKGIENAATSSIPVYQKPLYAVNMELLMM